MDKQPSSTTNTEYKPCPNCKSPMVVSTWDGWRWMCLHCDYVGREATDEEIDVQEAGA